MELAFREMIPCVGTIALALVIFGFVVVMRYLKYRETLALAEKGLVRPERARGNGKDALRWGIAIAAVGMALCVGLYPIGWVVSRPGDFPLGFGPWMLIGLIPTFFGLGLILIYVLTREEKKPENGAERKPEEPPSAA
jgi:hypothetical protein